MDDEEKIEENFQGKTGEENNFEISNEYPYTILAADEYGFSEEDTFKLESTDGTYFEEIEYKFAEKNEGYSVLWFPMPPKGKKYNLYTILKSKDEDSEPVRYFIFEEEILTFRDAEEPTRDEYYMRSNN